MNKKNMMKFSGTQPLIVGLAITIGYLGLTGLTFVQENDQLLVIRFNQYIRTIKDPGLYWINIIGRQLIWNDKRLLLSESIVNQISFRNGKKIALKAILLYRITDPLVLHLTKINLHDTLSLIVKGQILSNLSNQDLNSFVSNYTSIARKMLDSINIQLTDLGINAIDLCMTI